MSASLVTLVGMFFGADRRDLVRGILRYAMTRAAVIAIVMGTAFFVLAPSIVGAFTDSVAIANTGVSYLRVSVLSYPFIAVVMLTGRALQGMGRGGPLLVLSLLRVVLISGPLAYACVYWWHKPVEWVWYAIVFGMAVSAVIAFLWLGRALAVAERYPVELEDALASDGVPQLEG
jgi:Na+-driven multidrug efflux pump